MKVKKIASLAVILFAFGYLIFSIYTNWQVVNTHPWNLKSRNVVLLIGFLSVVYLVNATSWHFLMKAFGVNLSYLKNLKIWLFSNTARLIPGTIWQYGSRMVLASNEGVDKKTITSALFIELFFVLSLGALVTAFGIIWWNLQIPIDLKLLAILFCALTLLILFISKITKIRLNYKWTPLLFISYFLQFVIDGSVLFFLSSSAVEISFNLYPVFISIFAVSWLLGYLSFLAPAGLGIQEISIATLLSFYMPFPVASIVAISFRLVLLVSEGLTLLIVVYLNKKHK